MRLVRRLHTRMGEYGPQDAQHLLRSRSTLAVAGKYLVPSAPKLYQGKGTRAAPQIGASLRRPERYWN
ncbi:MAG TPA: hypothetical protein VEB61_14050 [Candidatus Binatia bacterium]|nr:hypothetical protein [Candidatus Binatia bacterium]